MGITVSELLGIIQFPQAFIICVYVLVYIIELFFEEIFGRETPLC